MKLMNILEIIANMEKGKYTADDILIKYLECVDFIDQLMFLGFREVTDLPDTFKYDELEYDAEVDIFFNRSIGLLVLFTYHVIAVYMLTDSGELIYIMKFVDSPDRFDLCLENINEYIRK